MIGKGFEWYVILELMLYASATNVAMALPLSVLLSSIMTYGNLGENYELVAIKSAGISLTRAMYPMFMVVLALSVSAFFFSDYMLPKANLKYFTLLYNVREQKSANFFPEGVFSNSFPNNTIRVQRKGADGQTLYGLTIYSKDPNKSSSFVLFAKEGKMYRSNDNNYLIIELKDGVRYEESPGSSNAGLYNQRRVFTRMRFRESAQKLDLSGLGFRKSNENEFKSAFQMMNIKLLRDTISNITHNLDSAAQQNYVLMTPYLKYLAVPDKAEGKVTPLKYKQNWLKTASLDEQLQATINAQSEVRSIQDLIKVRKTTYADAAVNQHSAQVEYQKKFTLSAACLALFLIGAPLGAIIRKGGLGLPVVVSVIFFLIYYIISTIGEKAVKSGDASPFIGMWISIVILTPIGLLLSYQAANDSVIFDADLYKRFSATLFNKVKGLFTKKAGNSVVD